MPLETRRRLLQALLCGIIFSVVQLLVGQAVTTSVFGGVAFAVTWFVAGAYGARRRHRSGSA
jgi:hypothetical protein